MKVKYVIKNKEEIKKAIMHMQSADLSVFSLPTNCVKFRVKFNCMRKRKQNGKNKLTFFTIKRTS